MKDDEARGEIPARGAGGQRSGLRRSTEGLTGGMKPGWVYLMANHRRGQTYLGVTSDLPRRAWQHRNKVIQGHSKDKGCTSLVWFEYFEDLQDARAQEWRMKKWKRAWKVRLIEERNPNWDDLYDTLF